MAKPNGGAAGFTLIESLVALAVAATGVSAIGSLSFSSLRSGVGVARHLALVETEQKIMTGLPGRNDLADGELTGVIDDHRWWTEAGPFAGETTGGTDWEPQLIALRVRAPSGAVIEIDTVRLRRRANR